MDHITHMRSILLSFPPFTLDDPDLWIGLMRSYFAAYNISSRLLQYHSYLIALGPQYAILTRDLVMHPPSEEELSDVSRYRERREELFGRLHGHNVHKLPKDKEKEDIKTHTRSELSPFPPFMPDDPPLWFGFMGSYFVLYNITSAVQRYHSFLIAVGPQYVGLIRDLVLGSPSEKDLSDDSQYIEKKGLLFMRLHAHKNLRMPEHEEMGEKKTAHVWSEILLFPPFMPDDPELWFALMRSYFASYNIRSAMQQYRSFLIAVGPQYVNLIKDLILYPPSEEDLCDSGYRKKRNELFGRFLSSKVSQRLPDIEEVYETETLQSSFTTFKA